MSVKIMSAVFDSEILNPTERLILLALADHADDEGRCYPSINRLCQRTGLSCRTVQVNIRRMQADGYIRIIPNGGKAGANLYFVRATPAGNAPPQQMHPPARNAPPTRSRCTTPPHLVQDTPAADAPEPSGTITEPPPPRAGAPEEAAGKIRDLIREIGKAVGISSKSLPKSWTNEAAIRLVLDWLDRGLSPEQVVDKAAESRLVHEKAPTSIRALDVFMVSSIPVQPGAAGRDAAREANLDQIAERIREGRFVPQSALTPSVVRDLIASGRLPKDWKP
ncbi:helix-turn-helix domain-containing protein [Paenirhodobacter populi]|nr:helix-turn-helix domain-containing protein [Sinirhodobacter populi]